MADVPTRLAQLVETFDQNIEAYKTNAYNEAQLRREFIDPFFQTLGWDVTNEQGWAPAYREVIHEDAIKVGGYTKAPDYCFRIGGVRKFFLEAKKPSIDIRGDPHPAYQLRRYAWSAKLPLSILTDFEEFAVYDCQIRPKQTDKAAAARVMYYNYKQYLDHWHEIEGIFSKDAIFKGSFDKYTASTKAKRGTGTVDKEFLAEIEKWREMLARTIALKNRALTREQINFAVQRTIDRILFLRMCEDRGIETYSQLLALSTGRDTYQRLCHVFRKADAKYNSGLFHFQHEKNRPTPPDEFTPNIVVDDTPLKWILHSLYYPQSPYEFSVLPAEILGNVYEQFLGQVIELTPAHRAKIELKPEVKKAGGVYYTPSYIVDYIVKNTVGKLLSTHTGGPSAPTCHSREGGNPGRHCEGQSKPVLSAAEGKQISNKLKTKNSPLKTPAQVANLRILDPACGSGSFLLGAYTYLLDYHRDWYVQHNPQKHKHKVYQGKGAQYFLTIAEKKRILLSNIFGVDIDSQAVEVTKLSLLLKVLEGESQDTVESQYKMFHERALPDLANNIKCGNSLIGPDFYDDLDTSSQAAPTSSLRGAKPRSNLHPEGAPSDELRRRINAFDWKAEFPKIFAAKNPGFHAIIGNPPYVRIQTLKETQPESVSYFTHKYQSATKGNYDIYVVFVQKALQLLNPSGRMGYILPHKFFNAKYGQPLRSLIATGKHLSHVVHFGDQQVFAGATTYTCLLFLTKSPTSECQLTKIDHLIDWRTSRQAARGSISANCFTESEWNFIVGPSAVLFERLKRLSVKLADLAHVFVGLQTSADPVFILDVREEAQESFIAYSKSLDQVVELERGICKPLLKGSDIHRYSEPANQLILIFPYAVTGGKATPLGPNEFCDRFPKAHRYLKANSESLLKRANSKKDSWFLYTYPKNLAQFASPKIITGVLALKASFTIDRSGVYYFVGGGNAGGYGIRLKDQTTAAQEYLLALLNSSLLDYFVKKISTRFRGGYYSYARRFIEHLPIRTIDFDNPDDIASHDKMVKLVDRMFDLHHKLAAAKVPDEKTRIQRQIDTTDKKIDNLVYHLYSLTQEEIKIIEQS